MFGLRRIGMLACALVVFSAVVISCGGGGARNMEPDIPLPFEPQVVSQPQDSGFGQVDGLKREVSFDYSTAGFAEQGGFTLVPMFDDFTPGIQDGRLELSVDSSGVSPVVEVTAQDADGGIHALTNYLTIEGVRQYYEFTGLTNHLAVPVNDYSIWKSWGGFFGYYFNPTDGYFAVIENDFDLGAQTQGTYLIKPANGKTIFTP